MNSFASARVVVVAGENSGRPLAQSLTRMGLSTVTVVASPQEAQLLCEASRADICVVVLQRPVPDEVAPWSANAEAPGRSAGVPSLLVADVVTPQVAKAARNSGYFGTMAVGLPPQMLYRSVRALLQRRRRHIGATAMVESEPQDPVAVGVARALSSDAWYGGKVKLQ